MLKTDLVYSQPGWTNPTNQEKGIECLKLGESTRIQVGSGLQTKKNGIECLKLVRPTRRQVGPGLQHKKTGTELMKPDSHYTKNLRKRSVEGSDLMELDTE